MSVATPFTRDERVTGVRGAGLIQLFEGDGKGKTTAALGEAVRAVGAGWRVAIVYFDKGGAHYCERETLDRLFKDEIEWHATGRDRIDPITGRFDFSITDEDRAEAERGLSIVRKLFTAGEHQLVILDEINSTVSLGMLGEQAVLDVLASKPKKSEAILTGRNAPASFKEAAHLVTRMELVRHYFYSGVKARAGFDF